MSMLLTAITCITQSDLKLPSLCMPSASVPCPSRKHHGKMVCGAVEPVCPVITIL